ncbi:type IV pilin protein [Clostridium hydrogeniformans]|uniref:type IV pilin protein n=1 Tax=Clostridium hydrogeniformans TaxID=349933 RepID=UPI000558E62B|nr:type II secretion system protein [Clostridium hydrogeniformans]
MKKKGFTLVELMAVVAILLIFLAMIPLGINIKKSNRVSLEEFTGEVVRFINESRYYCINKNTSGKIALVKDSNEHFLKFSSNTEERMILYIPSNIKTITLPNTNGYDIRISINSDGVISGSGEINIINDEDKRKILGINSYSRGIYEKN